MWPSSQKVGPTLPGPSSGPVLLFYQQTTAKLLKHQKSSQLTPNIHFILLHCLFTKNSWCWLLISGVTNDPIHSATHWLHSQLFVSFNLSNNNLFSFALVFSFLTGCWTGCQDTAGPGPGAHMLLIHCIYALLVKSLRTARRQFLLNLDCFLRRWRPLLIPQWGNLKHYSCKEHY